MRKKTISNQGLDAEEQVLFDSFEAGEWKSVDDFDVEKELAEKAADAYFKKNARINIRLSSSDLNRIKQIAAYEGLPYQTLLASIIHKFAAGRLIERNQTGM